MELKDVLQLDPDTGSLYVYPRQNYAQSASQPWFSLFLQALVKENTEVLVSKTSNIFAPLLSKFSDPQSHNLLQSSYPFLSFAMQKQ